jgi:serine/threonine protein kinase
MSVLSCNVTGPACVRVLQVLKCPYKSKPEENKEKEHLHYSNTVDSWAVGVLLYELLVGCPPFYDKSKSNTEARIVSGVPHFPPTISEAAKSFICAGECSRTGQPCPPAVHAHIASVTMTVHRNCRHTTLSCMHSCMPVPKVDALRQLDQMLLLKIGSLKPHST